MPDSNFQGYKVVRSYLVINFILLVILLLFIYLAIDSERINTSLVYSPEGIDRWCAADPVCDQVQGNTNNKFNIFSLVPRFSETVTDQIITLQTYADYDINNVADIKAVNFDIYLAEEPPSGTEIYPPGLCAGFNNYSDYGVSIYLKYFWNSTSWTSNNIDASVLPIFTRAFEGTSAYYNNYAILENSKNVLKLELLTDNNIGLSVFTDVTKGISSIFSNDILNIPINENRITYLGDNYQPLRVLNNYKQTQQTIKKSAQVGTCYLRCIDPSYTVPVWCYDNEIEFNNDTKLYYHTGHKEKGTSLCTSGQIENGNIKMAMQTTGCGIPFCNQSKADNEYQSNAFKISNIVNENILSTSENYTIDQETFVVQEYTNNQTFNKAPQAQKLLFCAGTCIFNNNVADTLYTANGEFPKNIPDNNKKSTPLFSNQPNINSLQNITLGFN